MAQWHMHHHHHHHHHYGFVTQEADSEGREELSGKLNQLILYVN